MQIIPAIDLRGGSCVRLYKGDFDKETQYSNDPQSIANRYESMGFRRLHIVDLDGAQHGEQRNRDLVRGIVNASELDVQLGGGIRDPATVADWLETGVQRVVIGSIAVTDPDTVTDWMNSFGAERFVLALDCRCDASGTPMLATHGWTRTANTTLWDCLATYDDSGVTEVLCTDISRDGAMSGPSVALYREFRRRFPSLQLQASGGVRHIDDLHELRAIGAAGAITGRALLDGRISDEEVSTFLRDA